MTKVEPHIEYNNLVYEVARLEHLHPENKQEIADKKRRMDEIAQSGDIVVCNHMALKYGLAKKKLQDKAVLNAAMENSKKCND